MKTIIAAYWGSVPRNYTGVIQWPGGIKEWYKNGEYHREDGPVRIFNNSYKIWCLDNSSIFSTLQKQLDLTNKTILSKVQHPDYPTVQIWKILGPNGLYEQVIILGMEEFIIE